MRPRRYFLSLLLLLCSLPLLAQEYKLSGRVTGGEGEAVVGARVTLSHEGQILAFAFTRKGGRFALTSDRSYPRMKLSISHLSYETDSLSLTPDRHEVTLRLSPRVSQLQEVTVEAYPIIERSDTLTYLLRSAGHLLRPPRRCECTATVGCGLEDKLPGHDLHCI